MMALLLLMLFAFPCSAQFTVKLNRMEQNPRKPYLDTVRISGGWEALPKPGTNPDEMLPNAQVIKSGRALTVGRREHYPLITTFFRMKYRGKSGWHDRFYELNEVKKGEKKVTFNYVDAKGGTGDTITW